MYLGVVAELDSTIDLDPTVLQAVTQSLREGDLARAGAAVPNDILDLFSFSGTPDHVAHQAQQVLESGANRIEFGTPHGLQAERGITLLGRRVLPQLGSSMRVVR